LPRYNPAMNELPSLPDPNINATAGIALIDASHVRAAMRPVIRRMYAGLALLLLLLLGLWIFASMATSNLREKTARHLKTFEVNATEDRLQVKASTETARQLQAKVTVIESKQIEAQSQQLALEQLYQDLSKNRDDWALAEIEQVLSIASQQLQLAGNVQGALIALQNADSRLSRADRPQFIAIRRALARDIERLKALPSLDLTGIALRLDSIIGQIDAMPLLAGATPMVPMGEPKSVIVDALPSSNSVDLLRRIENNWQRWRSEMWVEVRQLIRVRSVEIPDALLLSPTQAYYAKENLKLRLLNARLALLSRNESAFRSDMIAAQEAISKYFDTRAQQTQTAQTLLRQVQGSNLAIELPTLSESLNAVRNYKVKP